MTNAVRNAVTNGTPTQPVLPDPSRPGLQRNHSPIHERYLGRPRASAASSATRWSAMDGGVL